MLDVLEFLSSWAVPISASIITDRETSQSKGFGFATAASSADALLMCGAHERELMGRRLTVNLAKPMKPRDDQSSVEAAAVAAESAVRRVLTTVELHDVLMPILATRDSSEMWVKGSLADVGLVGDEWQTSRRQMAKFVQRIAVRPALLFDVDPRMFEHVVAALLASTGYSDVRLSLPSADGGVDIYASQDSLFGRSLYLMQCKRHRVENKVTRPQMQQLYGVLSSQKATQAVMFTSSTFTGPAQEFIDDNSHHIGGMNYSDIKNWLHDAYVSISTV